ncbi:HIR complex subunit [Saitoella coloradoensis]
MSSINMLLDSSVELGGAVSAENHVAQSNSGSGLGQNQTVNATPTAPVAVVRHPSPLRQSSASAQDEEMADVSAPATPVSASTSMDGTGIGNSSMQPPKALIPAKRSASSTFVPRLPGQPPSDLDLSALPDRPNISIDISLNLQKDGEAVQVNFAQLAEKTYGWAAVHPVAAATLARLQAEKLAEMSSDDEAADDDSDDEETAASGADGPGGPEKDAAAKMKRKYDTGGLYDLKDDFIDDSEILLEEMAAAHKDGFFVYSGPLVQQGEKVRIERPDGTAKRGRGGRGRGRGAGTTRGGRTTSAAASTAAASPAPTPAAVVTTTGTAAGAGIAAGTVAVSPAPATPVRGRGRGGRPRGSGRAGARGASATAAVTPTGAVTPAAPPSSSSDPPLAIAIAASPTPIPATTTIAAAVPETPVAAARDTTTETTAPTPIAKAAESTLIAPAEELSKEQIEAQKREKRNEYQRKRRQMLKEQQEAAAAGSGAGVTPVKGGTPMPAGTAATPAASTGGVGTPAQAPGSAAGVPAGPGPGPSEAAIAAAAALQARYAIQVNGGNKMDTSQ